MTLEGRVVRFETVVDWHERHKILKVAFPVSVTAREAAYEVQFGHVMRPTHFEDSRARAMFEVCAQRWADLGDGDYGVALLNDCKHGYDIHDGVMRARPVPVDKLHLLGIRLVEGRVIADQHAESLLP